MIKVYLLVILSIVLIQSACSGSGKYNFRCNLVNYDSSAERICNKIEKGCNTHDDEESKKWCGEQQEEIIKALQKSYQNLTQGDIVMLWLSNVMLKAEGRL